MAGEKICRLVCNQILFFTNHPPSYGFTWPALMFRVHLVASKTESVRVLMCFIAL